MIAINGEPVELGPGGLAAAIGSTRRKRSKRTRKPPVRHRLLAALTDEYLSSREVAVSAGFVAAESGGKLPHTVTQTLRGLVSDGEAEVVVRRHPRHGNPTMYWRRVQPVSLETRHAWIALLEAGA